MALSPGIAPGIFITALVVVQPLIGSAVRDTLGAAWSLHEYAQQLVDEANTNRGEVMRLNKSINLAYALLERHAQKRADARNEAAAARNLKEQFAVYVSHELRTPLNIILGFLEVIQCLPETYGENGAPSYGRRFGGFNDVWHSNYAQQTNPLIPSGTQIGGKPRSGRPL